MSDNQKPKSALDRAFEQFEADTAECKAIRKELIDQLRKDMKYAQVTSFDKPMLVQAKMSMITTLNGMLKDVEDASMKSVKLNLSRTEQENNGQSAQAIVALLKAIRADDVERRGVRELQNNEQMDAELRAQAEKEKIVISEGETSTCSGSFDSNAAKPEETKE